MPAVESVLCIVNSLVSSHVTGSLQETWSYLRRLILYGLFVRLHTKMQNVVYLLTYMSR